jgi:hypothetical protein
VIIPVARTPEQSAAAHGAPFDAQDVIRRQGTEWHLRRPMPRGVGHDLFRSVLALLLVGILFVFGLSFLDVIFRMLGQPLGLTFGPRGAFLIGLGYSPLTNLLVALGLLGLVLWSFSARRSRSRSFLASFLNGAVHLIAIIVMGLIAFRAFAWVDLW